MAMDTKLIKSAGEHWACSVLAGLGWAASLTRDGIARTDLVAVNAESGAMIAAQVKTTRSISSPVWMLGTKGVEPARASSEFYILVALPELPWEQPRGFVVPNNHVAAGLHISYTDWLTDTDVRPGSRSTALGSARTHWSVFANYENRWDLLEESGFAAPVLLPPRFRALATQPRVGLPRRHPWLAELPLW